MYCSQNRAAYPVVYLFLVSYGRSKPDQIQIVIPSFLQVFVNLVMNVQASL